MQKKKTALNIGHPTQPHTFFVHLHFYLPLQLHQLTAILHLVSSLNAKNSRPDRVYVLQQVPDIWVSTGGIEGLLYMTELTHAVPTAIVRPVLFPCPRLSSAYPPRGCERAAALACHNQHHQSLTDLHVQISCIHIGKAQVYCSALHLLAKC